MTEIIETADEGIYAVFERVALQHGDRLALRGVRDYTYAQLYAATQRMAARVAAFVDDGRPVAITGPVEASTAVMMLGVLGAGRVVCVLDARLPDDRLRDQLATLDSRIVCATADQRARMTSLCASEVTMIEWDEDDADEAAEELIAAPSRLVCADDPAVIVFTSGSTGRPKAVLQKHRRHLLRAQTFDAKNISRVLLWHSLAYSGGVTSLMKVVLTGGAGVYYSLREKGLRGLSAVLAEHGIQQLTLEASIFREYLSLIEDGEPPPPVRVMRIGGQVYGRDLRRARALLRPDTQLSNAYALSEAYTLAECFWKSGDVLPDDDEIVPAGIPLPGRQIDLRDEQGRSVAVGQTGRIFIRAREVALGYYNDEAATAERFRVVDDAGTREYDTGDLGSFGADGRLRVHGRVDGVVKVRGVRIGLSEVDGTLESLPQVQNAVSYVLTKDGEEELGAMLVLRAGADLDMQRMREALRSVLPESMIPSDVRVASKLPRTTTSKIDRIAARNAALATPHLPLRTFSRAPPRGELEEQLARIWADALGVSVSDRHADFFALGGHSLKAMRLIAEVEKRFGVPLTLTELVEGPTLLEQAVLVRERRGRAPTAPKAGSTLVTYSSQGSGAPIFVIPPNNGTAMAQIPLAKALGGGRPIHLLQPPGWSPGEQPAATYDELADHYLQHVQRAAGDGRTVLIAVCGGARPALVMARRLSELNREPELVVLLDPPAGRVRSRPRHRMTAGDHLYDISELARHRRYGQLRSRVLGGLVRTLLRPISARHRRMHEMFVATSEASWRHEARPYGGRALLVTSEEHDKIPAERRRWESLCNGRWEVVSVPGCTHRDMVVGVVADQVAAVIERALAQP